ncbi:unnamed protein product [Owenia fusiformis]|uniref:Plant heme peroxidase family profile domain-containing protein n=1 Tax=Owenia fusiformis TaxID=6347 RepID=A0A8S4P140_OWEFU|nr:unnamed protein product [Owenia fusiformis]
MRLLLVMSVTLLCIVMPLHAQKGSGGRGGGGRGGNGGGGRGGKGGRRTSVPSQPSTPGTTPEEIVTTTVKIVTTTEEIVTTQPLTTGTTPEEIVTTTDEIITIPEEIETTPKEIVTTTDEIVTTPEEIETTPEEIVTTTDEIVTTPESTTSGPSFPQLTSAQVTAMKDSINVLLDANANVDGNGPNLIAGLVRLAFHDCVGGCDGCINLDNPENVGLDEYINMIDEAFIVYSDIISRADFWALASITANERAAEDCRPRGRCTPSIPMIEFQTGRRDCATSPLSSAEHIFPDPHGGLDPTESFFASVFGFNRRESVAILGAHTLGRARRQNSGFRNPWVGRERTLDNDYYRELLNIDRNWNQVDVANGRNGGPKWQWVHGDGRRLMLNADMCLFKEMELSSGTGESGCPYSGTNACPNSAAAGIVQEFANDNALWIQEYGAAFQKMIATGYTSDDFTPIALEVPVDNGSGDNPGVDDPINPIGINPIFEDDIV